MHKPDEYKTVLRSGISGTLLSQSLKLFIQIGSLPILARTIEPAEFGYFSIIFAIYLVFDLVRDLGLSIYQFGAQNVSTSQRTNLFWVSVISGFIFYLLALPVIQVLSSILDIPHNIKLYSILFLGLVINGVSAQFLADLRINLKFKSIAVSDISSVFLSVTFSIGIALGNGGVWALVCQQLALSFVSGLLYFHNSQFRPGFPNDLFASFRDFKLSLLITITQLIDLLSKSLITFQFGREISLTQMGYLDRAQQLQNIPNNSLNVPIRNLSLPILRSIATQKRELEKSLLRWQFVLLNISFLSYSFLFINSDLIIHTVYGKDYVSAELIFKIFFLIAMVQSTSHVGIWVILLSKANILSLKLSLFNLILVFVSVQIGLAFGIIQALIGLLIANFFKSIQIFSIARKISGLSLKNLQKQSFLLLVTYFSFSFVVIFLLAEGLDSFGNLNLFILNNLLLLAFFLLLLCFTHLFPNLGKNDFLALVIFVRKYFNTKAI